MKKNLSITLSLVALTMSGPVFANSEFEASTRHKIEHSVSDELEYLCIYDETKHTVQAIIYNPITNETTYGPIIFVDPNERKIHEDTFLNFEYDIWETDPQEWQLERPDTIFSQNRFRVYENDSNSSELRSWKRDVDNLNTAEKEFIKNATSLTLNVVNASIESYAAISSGGILTAGAIESIVSTVIAIEDMADSIEYICYIYNDCVQSFSDVYNNTDNMHD
ncbi:hypothetical protein AN642_02570 [Epulopiscium sp. SCG-B10WGA-EpuloA2]|nr:hypothetical protein AN642_02570 [Epulopiscium sp. SCG-B10WGA-EpuloA2]